MNLKNLTEALLEDQDYLNNEIEAELNRNANALNEFILNSESESVIQQNEVFLLNSKKKKKRIKKAATIESLSEEETNLIIDKDEDNKDWSDNNIKLKKKKKPKLKINDTSIEKITTSLSAIKISKSINVDHKISEFFCNVCNYSYPSKTKLFAHINTTGHQSGIKTKTKKSKGK